MKLVIYKFLGRWSWKLVARNGVIIAMMAGYWPSCKKALKAARRVMDCKKYEVEIRE